MGNCAGKDSKEPSIGYAPPRDPPLPPARQRAPQRSSDRRVVALYDFDARDEEEVSFYRDDILIVIDDSDQEWWKARHESSEVEGFIPRNYVTDASGTNGASEQTNLNAHLWYHPNITRQDASQHLRRAEPGSFLVRDSNKDADQYVLVLKQANEPGGRNILNYKIQFGQGVYFISERTTFATVAELIDFYQRNDGLKMRLTDPVHRQVEEERERDKWEIERSNISKTKVLGSGHFGEVYQGLWTIGNKRRKVAVKQLKTGTMSPTKFLAEATMMKDLQHPKIVKLLAIVSHGEPLMIITEFMDKGDLRAYLTGEEGPYVEEDDLRAIGWQIASGMAYLEMKNYSHRDLAARNVLMTRGNIAKIADFGLSKMLDDPEAIYQAGDDCKFPIKWTAPEAIEFLRFGIKSDIWAFGVTLFEVFTKGKVPYAGTPNGEILKRLKRGERLPRDDIPVDIYGIMRDCWEMNDKKRPTFEYLEKTLGATVSQSYQDKENEQGLDPNID